MKKAIFAAIFSIISISCFSQRDSIILPEAMVVSYPQNTWEQYELTFIPEQKNLKHKKYEEVFMQVYCSNLLYAGISEEDIIAELISSGDIKAMYKKYGCYVFPFETNKENEFEPLYRKGYIIIKIQQNFMGVAYLYTESSTFDISARLDELFPEIKLYTPAELDKMLGLPIKTTDVEAYVKAHKKEMLYEASLLGKVKLDKESRAYAQASFQSKVERMALQQFTYEKLQQYKVSLYNSEGDLQQWLNYLLLHEPFEKIAFVEEFSYWGYVAADKGGMKILDSLLAKDLKQGGAFKTYWHGTKSFQNEKGETHWLTFTLSESGIRFEKLGLAAFQKENGVWKYKVTAFNESFDTTEYNRTYRTLRIEDNPFLFEDFFSLRHNEKSCYYLANAHEQVSNVIKSYSPIDDGYDAFYTIKFREEEHQAEEYEIELFEYADSVERAVNEKWEEAEKESESLYTETAVDTAMPASTDEFWIEPVPDDAPIENTELEHTVDRQLLLQYSAFNEYISSKTTPENIINDTTTFNTIKEQFMPIVPFMDDSITIEDFLGYGIVDIARQNLTKNIPPEKRIYASELTYGDINDNGTADCSIFYISNGELKKYAVYELTETGIAELPPNETVLNKIKETHLYKKLIPISLYLENDITIFSEW